MIIPLCPQIHCITDELTTSNCYILTQHNHTIIIDPNIFSSIDTYLIRHHSKPDLVILTHEHCDHISGLNELREKYPISVIASTHCSQGIQDPTANMTRIMESYLYFQSQGKTLVTYPKFTCTPADICFEDRYTFFWKNHKINIYRVPGHTPGSCYIDWDNNMFFTGDYLIKDEPVITRLPGGNSEEYHKIGLKLLANIPTHALIYPGHGMSYRLTSKDRVNYGL